MTKNLLFLFLLASVLNAAVFLFRDSFQYQPTATYAELYGECNANCLASWKGAAARYSQSDLEAGRRILDTVVRKNSQTAKAKVFDIASFLYTRFHSQAGTPNDYIKTALPLDQYKQLSKDKSLQLWCGNFGTMLFFFCWAENIPCRAIEIINKGQHHIVNEFYDEESGSWIFADAMNNLFLLKNDQGKYLNLVDFIDAVNRTAGKIGQGLAQQLKGLEINPTYYSSQSELYYYHDFDKDKVYSFRAKLRRYFLPVSWYEIYGQQQGSPVLFYGKLLLLLCWIVLVLVMVTRRVRRIVSHNKTSLSQ